MKIKAVCAQTGLTDRTIRYYIEQGLIAPAYEENYTGRRTYDFLERDIAQLQDIAILRKFDFTIEEIHSILNDAQASRTVIAAVRERTETTAQQCREKLAALEQIDTGKTYTLPELAQELSRPSQTLPAQNETESVGFWGGALSLAKAAGIAVVVWAPLVLSIVALTSRFKVYTFPVFEFRLICLTAVAFLPSVAVLAISRLRFRYRDVLRGILLVFCVLSIPFCVFASLGVVSRSETTDFHHYRQFDPGCTANRDILFQQMLPVWPRYFEVERDENGKYRTVFLDSHYYYHYFAPVDYTYDIYAQWPLEEEDYREEVERVTALFEKEAAGEFIEMEKGDYHCLIRYSGDEPFSPATDNYSYLIFAHDDDMKTVRYILCNSLENGIDQPYYLSLEW